MTADDFVIREMDNKHFLTHNQLCVEWRTNTVVLTHWRSWKARMTELPTKDA